MFKHYIFFWKKIISRRAVVLVPFAIMFPVLLGFVALGLDMSYLLNKRAHFDRAISESLLAVAAQDIRKSNSDESKHLVDNYIMSYSPDLTEKDFNTRVLVNHDLGDTESSVVYQVDAKIYVKSLLPLKEINWIGFNRTVKFDSFSDQKVKKYIGNKDGGIDYDIALVADFSGSMASPFDSTVQRYRCKNDNSCRIDALKKVTAAIVDKIKGTNHQITFVPWDHRVFLFDAKRQTKMQTQVKFSFDNLSPVLSTNDDTGFLPFREENIENIALSYSNQLYGVPHYIVPLTKNDQDKEQLMKAVNNMWPSGGTNSYFGLLRSITPLAKGENKGKLIIVLSDGDESNPVTHCKLHINRSNIMYDSVGDCRASSPNPIGDDTLCNMIKKGFKSAKLKENGIIKQSVDVIDLHYISIGKSGQHAARIRFWAEHCVGANNVHTAENYEDLLTIFEKILKSRVTETGYFMR